MRPTTIYARSPGGFVAYQVFREGPRDILFIAPWPSNVDAMWDEPTVSHFFQRLMRLGRVICFDKRGAGVSDPVPLTSLPTLEEWMDDARIVMDAAGSKGAVLVGDYIGGLMAMMFAATYPDRTRELILTNSWARWARSADYPIGMPAPTVEKLVQSYERSWGQNADGLFMTAPSVAHDERFRDWFVRYQRLSMPLGASTAMFRWVLGFDVRSILSTIRVPTLVIQRREGQFPRRKFGRFLADHIPGARLIELPGAEQYPFHAGDSDSVLDEIEVFVTGSRRPPTTDRVLSTVLFTDIVGSTDHAARLGDARWLELRDAHDELVRTNLVAFRGREIETAGDEFLVTFDGPARAVQYALRIRNAVADLGLQIRVGLHTGEVELRGSKIGGLAVHLAARVMAAAEPGQVLASGTVGDLVTGSGIEFEDRGIHELKGVPGRWRLLEVTGLP